MIDYYLILIALLFILAISDLMVGVSNDAVNFLNSAIGSQVATRRTIMLVASVGIMLGALFSGGMIEVARKGIFNPEYFYFSEIMVIFLAVMITDVILLDLFNTFGMPTSTTVSIVFELLGAAVAVAVLKLMADPNLALQLGDFINSSSALKIISGIFLSVFIAFLVGVMVQYLSRLLFSFNLDRRMSWVGPIWAGFAITAMAFFLLIKGLKGASFVTDSFMQYIQTNRTWLMLSSVVIWAIIMKIAHSVFKLNILRLVVLFGTFSLAMAFAGNDLVNFIGVPIAGLESYLAWEQSGINPDTYGMQVLSQPVRTNTFLLFMAGVIMVFTLWISKKSRSVTETEVNLGRQNEGAERFKPNALSKGIVRMALPMGRLFQTILPNAWLQKIRQNFAPAPLHSPTANSSQPPAFDLVRASVNLTTASVLIAIATSMKLPLSTTYVSFMVAMGASLADQAWGRNSAVFRVAGVLNVIGGWFLTALIAFTAAATFAVLIHFLGGWGVLGLVLLIVFMVTKTMLFHRKKRLQTAQQDQKHALDWSQTKARVAHNLDQLQQTHRDALNGLLSENRHQLKQALQSIEMLNQDNLRFKHKLHQLIQHSAEADAQTSRRYVSVYDLEQDLMQSMRLVVQTCHDHVDHCQTPLSKDQAEQLLPLTAAYATHTSHIIDTLSPESGHVATETNSSENSIQQTETMIAAVIQQVQNAELETGISELMLDLMLETRDLINTGTQLLQIKD